MLYVAINKSKILGYMFLLLLFLYFPIKILFNLARQSMHESYNASKEANNFIQILLKTCF